MMMEAHKTRIRPEDLILVIDMQNVYRPGQPWGCASFDRSLAQIRLLLDTVERLDAMGRVDRVEREGKAPSVCFTRFLHNPNASGVWAEYNRVYREINDTPWMNALADELRPYTEQYPVYEKSVYSSMRIPEIRRFPGGTGRIVLTGVVSECCVLSTCMEAIDLGFSVVYLRDACSGDDDSTEDAVVRILSRLPLHVAVLTTADYLCG